MPFLENENGESIENESLDLIWSEGAIYNIGFERGLNEWKKYLKKDGKHGISPPLSMRNVKKKNHFRNL